MNDNLTYNFGKVVYDLSLRTHVMGILNVTPDSFSDGGKYMNFDAAIEHGIEMEKHGADFIDVGGMSTKPGSDEIPEEEEINRISKVIKKLSIEVKIPISIDTYRSTVAEEALKNGAVIVNDITAFNHDEKMGAVIKKYNASVVLMHIKGMPKNMQDEPKYDDLIGEIKSYLEKAIWKANVSGIDQVIIDPGIGFGKTPQHNIELLKHIGDLRKLDCPVMIGLSRKNFISKLTGAEMEDRVFGTIALNSAAIIEGANIIRVHDVKQAVIGSKLIDITLK
jgi:dihydropteroate synthase